MYNDKNQNGRTRAFHRMLWGMKRNAMTASTRHDREELPEPAPAGDAERQLPSAAMTKSQVSLPGNSVETKSVIRW